MVPIKQMPVTCHYLTNTLRPLSDTWKRRVRERYTGPTKLDDAARRQLSEAIFAVENEHEYGLGSNSTPIRTLRAIRNVLLDDLGENENREGSRFPFIEAVAATIREKRHAGRGAEAMARIRPLRSGEPSRDRAPAIDTPADGSETMEAA